MTQYLTNLWKNKKLKEGYYYIRTTKEEFGILIDKYRFKTNDCGHTWFGFDNYETLVKDVLAKVPSYSEYSELKRKTRFSK